MTEKEEIEISGMVPQKNSGRGRGIAKGDAILKDKFLVDIKEYSKSFSISQASWGKICADAFKAGYQPALKLVLGVSTKTRTRVWVISDESMKEYMWLLEKEQNENQD